MGLSDGEVREDVIPPGEGSERLDRALARLWPDLSRSRLQALIRRRHGQLQPELRHGNVVMQPASHSVLLNGEPLELKSRELALLELFLRHPAQVLTRSQLEEKLYSWDDDVSSNAVEVHIHHLRKKLGSQFIRTGHGIGYTLGAAE